MPFIKLKTQIVLQKTKKTLNYRRFELAGEKIRSVFLSWSGRPIMLQ
jgi:hypothetical protein